ncbi:efflux RND transporter periplasmic adaptor subunit [Parashewanella hymeniacidonis]|uniref:efflux RND transporter periplasmic adaptor subunit n=1 Tax=Parashewanella hymeniacidonis TaxID=2807618 RepID=UPI001EF5C2A4|nr:efflux RND transporter periplasmic adaptor subunit [Parashewanella hymeniacidonis]
MFKPRYISILIASMLFMTACSPKQEVVTSSEVIQPVKLFTIPSEESRNTRTYPAKVAANKQADLSFRVSGVMEKRPPFEGVQVKKGQSLAKLEDKDAKNNLLNREADYELASAEFKRVQKLLKQKLISQSNYDTAKAKQKSADAALASAKDQLSYTTLYAPFDGIVAKVSVDNYQVVGANQAVLTLQKNDSVDLEVQIPEYLVAKYSVNERYKKIKSSAQFIGDKNHTYPVTLKEFTTQVTPGTQAYEVVFSLAQPKDLKLLPGMTAEVTFILPNDGPDHVYPVVPLSAVENADANGESVAWVFSNGQVKERTIKLGKITDDGIQIISGLTAGEQIVSAGIQHLSEDMKVKPLKWERGV